MNFSRIASVIFIIHTSLSRAITAWQNEEVSEEQKVFRETYQLTAGMPARERAAAAKDAATGCETLLYGSSEPHPKPGPQLCKADAIDGSFRNYIASCSLTQDVPTLGSCRMIICRGNCHRLRCRD